ncbi:hypothetical protein IAI18_03080 [Acetobacteraceae bacterium H6797]|nr:hypothetical protein [Acetobacteraceae bacterium H6797]
MAFAYPIATALFSLALLTGAARAESDAPADPAAAPPAPVQLGDGPTGPGTQPRTFPAINLVPGVQTLDHGGWKLTGPALQQPPSHGILAVLAEIGRLLAEQPTGRVTILAQSSGPADDDSIARRTSLAQGQAVRKALEAGGLAGTRIDIRPLGRTAEAADAVTILPPNAPQPAILR